MTLPNFDKSLKQYAELAVDIGVAVKPGDTVYLQIAVDQAKLAQLIVAAAYDRGAAEVQVQWHDDLIKRLDMAHMATSRLYNIPDFIKGQFDYWVDHNAKRITVISADPDNLAGLDPQRIANYQNAFNQAYARLMDAISSMKITTTIITAA
ncbi:MAG: aminopeptidase, partial [Lacticaseibacillus paracasei]|nr:aminopeptidase [Lacticaseibacillus paracasei]